MKIDKGPKTKKLGDFTTSPRVLLISAIAVIVGTAGVVAGVALLTSSGCLPASPISGISVSMFRIWRVRRSGSPRWSAG
jgi:hypothetical protein